MKTMLFRYGVRVRIDSADRNSYQSSDRFQRAGGRAEGSCLSDG